jgi:hypothetical protein
VTSKEQNMKRKDGGFVKLVKEKERKMEGAGKKEKETKKKNAFKMRFATFLVL